MEAEWSDLSLARSASSPGRASGRNLAKTGKNGLERGGGAQGQVRARRQPTAGPGEGPRRGSKDMQPLAFLPRSFVKEEREKGLDVVVRGQQDSFGWGTVIQSFFCESQQA